MSKKVEQEKKFDIYATCELAGLQINNTTARLQVRSNLDLCDKPRIGLLLLFLIGVFVGILTIAYSHNYIEIIIGACLGFGIAGFSVLIMLKQASDYLLITKENIEFRNDFKKRRLLILK
ncbi:hypothetical protein JMN32_17135 [Fulvivirga sp. 29W222]|uniref:Uncharacterized protein n=1 Tax=Fulvivirga marina TaxID=2494733 RepID=A0A937FXM6_9BACT|nr:hypothetical protein [Fulvivirga marina]MBL6448045.1 hypothetical protein [Fulvivirga marina]